MLFVLAVIEANKKLESHWNSITFVDAHLIFAGSSVHSLTIDSAQKFTLKG